MSRVITFSRTFPSYHPRKGESTYFVEQIWNGLNYLQLPVPTNKDLPHDFMWSILPLSNYGYKYHTIRAGKRWKVGDKFSHRVWSGIPYQSKQIIIADDIEIKKVWDFEIVPKLFLYECAWYINNEYINASSKVKELATNDGLTIQELAYWLSDGKMVNSKRKPFEGQIICWNENINY
jgi:hypothetical protein